MEHIVLNFDIICVRCCWISFICIILFEHTKITLNLWKHVEFSRATPAQQKSIFTCFFFFLKKEGDYEITT